MNPNPSRHPTPSRTRRLGLAVGPGGVDPAELVRMADELCTYMELVSRAGNVPPGAFAVHGRLMLVLDRALRGTSYRGEVEELIDAAEQFDKWRQDNGCKLSPAARAIRNRSLDVLHRLAGTLPEKPSRAADPDEDVALSTETMTVEAFAHAIGKSSRTVYRMARQGQLFVYREGVGRGTVLIYRDQVDPGNRPHVSANRLPPAAPCSVPSGRDRETSEGLTGLHERPRLRRTRRYARRRHR